MKQAYYLKHWFFCLNQRVTGKRSCQEGNATEMFDYAKDRIHNLHMSGPNGIRVNKAGCMGRCRIGPVCVIYPEGVWYTYKNQHDIDEIIEKHLVNGEVVTRLQLPDAPDTEENSAR